MKKIIDGFRYDTEKAVKIGYYDNQGSGASSTRDFQYWEAALYKTPRAGNYFLAGYGGPMTRYARAAGQNEWSGGEDLTPLSREDAFAWAEKYLPVEAVEAEFSDLIKEA
jgi:hypothetical protein